VFRLSTHPAYISVTQGVQDAFNYLQSTWRKWLPVVVVLAACAFVATAIFGVANTTHFYRADPETGRMVSYSEFTTLPYGNLGIVVLAGMVAGWVFAATAITGLRNRPLTVWFVVTRGLWSFLAEIILGLAFGALILALVVTTLAAPGLGVLLLFAAIPVVVYLYIRVVFYRLAIFDGFGPIVGMQESWRLSQGSVLRLFGWGLMAILIGIGFTFVSAMVSIPFTLAGAQPLAQALSTATTATGSCLTVFMMAVLYESERARKNPAAYGLTQMPYPYGPGPYAVGPNPYAQGPYAQGPYAQGPYPQGPYPSAPPTWPANQGPAILPYQGATPGYPGSQPPRWGPPNAPQAWPESTPTDPAATPPTGSAPTDPPTAG
jgi:hypothetical protein